MHKKIIVSQAVILSLGMMVGAVANTGWQLTAQTQDKNSHFTQRTALPMSNGLTADQDVDAVKLTPGEKHEALVWGMSDKEEKTYVLLMKNQAGVYYKDRHLTPLAILGINSTNNNDRLKWAQREARYESINNAKLLAWVATESRAIKAVNSGVPMILPFNTSQYDPNRYQPAELKPGDNIMMWTALNNSENRIITRYFISQLATIKNIHLNVYFTDKPINTVAIQDWARKNSIPVDLVKKKIITLNESQSRDDKDQFALFLVRHGKTQVMDVSRF